MVKIATEKAREHKTCFIDATFMNDSERRKFVKIAKLFDVKE